MLVNAEKLQKPQGVRHAEQALWVWTAWICLFGVYQSWLGIPEIEREMTEQLQGVFSLDPQKLFEGIVGGYAVVAVTSAWVVMKIGVGQNWARRSLLWGFVLEVLYSAFPPYQGGWDLLAGIPDFGLQIYALTLLYTKPRSDWFHKGSVH